MGLFFSSRTTKTHTDQNIIQVVNFVWKEMSHNPLKAAAAKNFFPSLYVNGTTCLDGCFLFHVITGKHYWTFDVSRTAFYEITLVGLFVCPSVCQFVHPSPSFLKTASSVLSGIVHGESWPWYRVTVEARFLKNIFRHFLEFGSLVFLQIAYGNSWQQCMAFSRGKTHEKTFLGPNFGPNKPKLEPKFGVFQSSSQVRFISFPWYCI